MNGNVTQHKREGFQGDFLSQKKGPKWRRKSVGIFYARNRHAQKEVCIALHLSGTRVSVASL